MSLGRLTIMQSLRLLIIDKIKGLQIWFLSINLMLTLWLWGLLKSYNFCINFQSLKVLRRITNQKIVCMNKHHRVLRRSKTNKNNQSFKIRLVGSTRNLKIYSPNYAHYSLRIYSYNKNYCKYRLKV